MTNPERWRGLMSQLRKPEAGQTVPTDITSSNVVPREGGNPPVPRHTENPNRQLLSQLAEKSQQMTYFNPED